MRKTQNQLTVGKEYVFSSYAEQPVVARVVNTEPDEYGCIQVEILCWLDSDQESNEPLKTGECWCYPNDLAPFSC